MSLKSRSVVLSRSHYKNMESGIIWLKTRIWGADKGEVDKVRHLEEMDIKRVSLQCSGKPMCTHKPVNRKWPNMHKMAQIVWNFHLA